MRHLSFLVLSYLMTFSAFPVFVAPASAAQVQREWTFLVYMNGNNNLDQFGTLNLNEMEQVGSTDKVNVVVQWASLEGGTTKRVYVTKDNDPNKVTSPILEDIGNVDMGDWRTLVEFVRWGAEHYPAKHYFLNVWNHGSGWHLKSNIRGNRMHATDISWDDKSHNHITTEQLGQAMTEVSKIIGHKLDIYGSDACLMAMPEVADEMSDSVETFIGSEEVEPGKGWPYDTFLTNWNSLADMSGSEVAKTLVRDYVKSYQGGTHGTESATLSAFDMSKLGALNRAIRDYGLVLKNLDKASHKKVLAAADASQKFAYSDYVDLLDFISQVSAARITGLGRSEQSMLKDAAQQFVIANAATESHAKAQGLAIWLPTSSWSFDSYFARYKGLHFHADTGWGDTIQALITDSTRSRTARK